MSKKTHIISGILFILSALVIWALFLVLYTTSKKENETLVSMTVDGSSDADFTFTMTHSDSWKDGLKPEKYAQFNGVISNNTHKDFINWTITLNFNHKSTIVNSWNGEYEPVDDKTVIVKPASYNYYFPAGQHMTFGYVLESRVLTDLEEIEFTGYFYRDWKENKLYFPLWIAFEAWIVAVLIYILVCFRKSAKKRRQQREEQILIHAIDTLVDFIEAKDEYTKGHSRRVANYTRKIAKRLKLPRDTIRDYYFAALMHDCGKIGIPDNILKKKNSLTGEEYETIKNHTTIGAGMLNSFKDIKNIELGALQHHERYDGTGYPKGLKGHDISEVARIICIADSFDVMNCDRCYKSRISKEEILCELKNNSGSQFDPDYIKVFLEMIDDGTITFD